MAWLVKLYDIDGEAADEFAELQMTAMPEVGDILIIEGTCLPLVGIHAGSRISPPAREEL